jgi:hypothetical protein
MLATLPRQSASAIAKPSPDIRSNQTRNNNVITHASYKAYTARPNLHEHLDVRTEFVDKRLAGWASEHEVRAGTDVEGPHYQARHGSESVGNVAVGLLGRPRLRHGTDLPRSTRRCVHGCHDDDMREERR